MIHSLAGGELRLSEIISVVKLEFEEKPGEYFWYMCNDKNIDVGDTVLAPFGIIDDLKRAKVVKLNRDMDSKNFPIPIKRLKTIYKKVE